MSRRRCSWISIVLLTLAALWNSVAGPVNGQQPPKAQQLPKGPATIEFDAHLMTPAFERGLKEHEAGNLAEAARQFRAALAERPGEVVYAQSLAFTLLDDDSTEPTENVISEVESIVGQFPGDGKLQALYAVALALGQRYGQAKAALERSRNLRVDPADVIGRVNVDRIEQLAAPDPLQLTLIAAASFVVLYAVVMVVMAVGGVILSRFSDHVPEGTLFVSDGHVALSDRESKSARWYMAALIAAIVLFYVAIPFVALGVIIASLALLYGVMLLPRIPVQLLTVIALTGLGMTWAILKSIFAKPASGAFGLLKTETECPRLYAVVREVAERIGTKSTDEIYLGPGAAIGVHQEGKGPFGALGVKRRVLTLGLASLGQLNIGELKSILAHEYAHFSHHDTAYNRFIHQVTMTIELALIDMAQRLGRLNYVNPFYWFFWCYHRTYSMLSAGFSRTREYLADRMAVSLYGKSAFVSGLTKVATDGQLFEFTAHGNIRQMLAEGKAFVNVYDVFRDFRARAVDSEILAGLEQGLRDERPSRFATHPTFAQRLAAVAAFPDVDPSETEPALSLLDNIQAIEEELTTYLTGYHQVLSELASPQ